MCKQKKTRSIFDPVQPYQPMVQSLKNCVLNCQDVGNLKIYFKKPFISMKMIISTQFCMVSKLLQILNAVIKENREKFKNFI